MTTLEQLEQKVDKLIQIFSTNYPNLIVESSEKEKLENNDLEIKENVNKLIEYYFTKQNFIALQNKFEEDRNLLMESFSYLIEDIDNLKENLQYNEAHINISKLFYDWYNHKNLINNLQNNNENIMRKNIVEAIKKLDPDKIIKD